jgi:flagellar basal-body rod protein FlgB
MPLNLNAYLGIQPDALQVYSQRAEVLAANLANADTPGYQARDIDFRAALAAADPAGAPSGAVPGPGPVQMDTTSPLDLTAPGSSGALPTAQFLKYRIPLAPSLDGNTVSSQLEEAKFAGNTVRFQAALAFLEQRFTELKTAITGQ